MNILRAIKRFLLNFIRKNKNYNMRRRRESVVSVYKKTTKFLSVNTPSLLKIMPNRKYRLLTRMAEELEAKTDGQQNKVSYSSEEEDFGERDLDYYLGVRKKEIYWRDPAGKEQIRKDFLLYHCGVSEEDYEKNYKKSDPKVSYVVQPKLKQVPFKIHRKRKTGNLKDDSWREKSLFRLFAYRRDSEYSTSDSYSECDSNEDRNDSSSGGEGSSKYVVDSDDEEGARIKEVSEGRPCDNCPELCPGFIPHAWRKTCKSCGCDRLKHSVYHEELSSVRDRLGLRDGSQLVQADTLPGLNAKETDIFWQSLAERAPAGVGGATGPAAWRAWRNRALASQLPKQDLSLAHCRHVDEVHRKQYEDFVAARNEIALDIGIGRQVFGKSLECMGCTKPIRSGNIAVEAPRLGEQAHFHPACFACAECEEPLVEFAYCALDGRLYCVRHYAERLKPRCHACDELIFSGEYTKAMNKDWHSGHFCCWQCDESLTGQRYVLRDEHPYCIKCYESVFANGCEECNKTIGIDSKDLSYKDKHWHEACFLCAKCRVSLVDKQFGSKLDKIYCGNCYDAQFASRCDGCGEVFRAGTKKMEYKTRQWHEKCFCCVVCKNPIGTKSFIPREQEIYCAGCYEDKFATRCVKCNKIITQGGVTYKNEPWHRECFTCTNCNTSLAGQRFTSRDEKPYCAECFGELFAKRCTACTKPITGIGGTRFISFEDRHWHNDCFICAQCKTSLVGKGFITDGQDIICPECAKQKLIEKTILPVVANARDWCEFKKQDTASDKLFDLTDKINFRKVYADPRS